MGSRKYAKAPRVVLVGVSLGGASSWLATEKAPDLFDAIVTEGSFAHLDDVANNFFDRRLPGGHIIFWPVKYFASKMARVNPSEVNPLEAAKKWHRPGLVIHCGADNLMKLRYARDLAAASHADLWIIANAGIAQGCVVDEQDYFQKLLAIAKK